ncbi:MAG: helix-turn-helix transcriptional regulator [Lachnospiraceae bacterium]|nr:helix-turn-helix transcriptional regulator [Lachnospiraceae bacterium]
MRKDTNETGMSPDEARKQLTADYIRLCYFNETLIDLTGHSEESLQELIGHFKIEPAYNLQRFWFCLTGLKKNVYYYIYHIEPYQYLAIYYPMKQRLHYLIEENGYTAEIFTVASNENQIAIIMSQINPKCTPVQMAQKIGDFVQRSYEKYIFKGDTKYCNVTSISKENHGLAGNYTGYLQADTLNQLSFFWMNTKVLTEERYKEAMLPVSYGEILRQIFHISKALEEGKTDKCRAEYNKLFNSFLIPSFSMKYVQDSLSYIKYYLQLQHTVRKTVPTINLDVLCDVKSYICIKECKNAVGEALSTLCSIIQKQGVYRNHTLHAAYYIIEHCTEDISLVDIADYVGVNPNYLSSIFREDMGMSVRNYITKERICIAKKLLIDSDMPVSDIAETVGIHDTKYFSQLLKKETKMFPTEYRLKSRKK